MKKTYSETIFTVGPFAETPKMLEEFASKMYFTFMFDDSIKKHTKIQEEYENALIEEDEELANMYLAELQIMESVYRASFSLFGSTDETPPS